MQSKFKHINVINFLRGFASLWVCWHHLGSVSGISGVKAFLDPNLLGWSVEYGYLGVPLFFVISGFIIPWSMQRSQYTLPNFGRFIIKRLIRLEPPYIISIFITISISYIVFAITGTKENFSIDIFNLFSHLGYLVPFFHGIWIQPVYWTLAVEFQYYILIGLIFPFLVHSNKLIRYTSLFSLGTFRWIFPEIGLQIGILFWIWLFIIGIVTFQYKSGLIQRIEYIVVILCSIGACHYAHGILYSAVACVAVLFIVLLEFKIKIFNFLGDISYSLYLLHYPIGTRTIRFLDHYTVALYQKIIVFIFAMALSIFSAYIFYHFVERISQRVSSSIKYTESDWAKPWWIRILFSEKNV